MEMYVDVSVTKLQEIVGDEKKKLQEQYTDSGPDNGEGRKFRILENLPSVKVFMGKAPVMIRSNFCHLKSMDDNDITKHAKECVFDQGGYFIINGSEKVIIANERMASNIVLVFHKKPPSKHSWVAEIRSQADNSNKPPLQFKVALSSKSNSQSTIECTISRIRDPIPVAILMRALGCTSDKQILNKIVYDPEDQEMSEAFRSSLEKTMTVMTQDAALTYIAVRGSAFSQEPKRRIQWAQSVLETDLLPHISTKPEGATRKAYFVGYMVNRLIQGSLGRAHEDDRDYYGKKRMDMAGALLSNLFRQQFRLVVEDMKKSIERDLTQEKKSFNIQNAIKADTITRGLRSALATGNWGKDKQGDVQKTGVAQVLNRLTFASSLSHLRRLNTPLPKSGKLSKPRQLHNSHWGMVCPAETPEGQACGLVKNLSLMALVSVGSPTKILAD